MTELRYDHPVSRAVRAAQSVGFTAAYEGRELVDHAKRLVGLDRVYYGSSGRSRTRNATRATLALLATLGAGVGVKAAAPHVADAMRHLVTPAVRAVGPDERGAHELPPLQDWPVTPFPEPRPVSATEALPPGYDRYDAGYGVEVVQKDGIPVWLTLSDGRKIPIDPSVVMQARASGEPEVIDVVVLGTKEPYRLSPPAPSQEKPETKELPADVLSQAALADHGIRIIQSDQTRLFIREGALKEGALLSDFNGKGRKLIIVLVDGPVVSSAFMSDPKYDDVRTYVSNLDDQAEAYRNEQISILNRSLADIRKELADALAKGNTERADFLREIIGSHKTGIFWYSHAASASDLVQEMERRKNEKGGLYYRPGADGTAVIFLAVGSADDRESLEILVDEKGRIFVYQSTTLAGLDNRPEASDTHPTPEDFERDPDASADNPSSYPYRMQTPGQGLRHELKHDDLIEVGGRSGYPNWSEYDTDMAAMQSIRDAHDRWVQSGYTDDSGYSFVFSLPEGGYILTKEDSSNTTKTFGL